MEVSDATSSCESDSQCKKKRIETEIVDGNLSCHCLYVRVWVSMESKELCYCMDVHTCIHLCVRFLFISRACAGTGSPAQHLWSVRVHPKRTVLIAELEKVAVSASPSVSPAGELRPREARCVVQ